MGKPHVLMIPYPVQGHVIPLMELAQCLAKQSIKITFVNSESTHNLIINSLSGRDILEDQIHLISIPDGLESNDRNVPGKLTEAVYKVMPRKIMELIQEMNISEDEKITCVIADQSLGWAQEVAKNMEIRRAAFLPAAAASLVLGFNIPKLIDDGIIDKEGTPKQNQRFQFAPAMPIMSTSDFVWTRFQNVTMRKLIFDLMVQNNKAVNSADWLICNSTYDLEPGAFTLAPEIVPIGPLLASTGLENSAGHFWTEDSDCLKWLDQQPPYSVIYVAFGSFTVFNKPQFQELALALELINRPFLWVVRPDFTNEGTEAFPEGFLDRVSTRGKLIGWAPQQKVLNHPSTACFLSHCGWNSTIESVSNGVPILCWPYFADQFINQSYICDVWKVGLQFEQDTSETITREEIKNKIDQLLGDNTYKERALHLKELMMSSVRGGKSGKNLNDFIEWINK
ncbi:UDP-glycosyltransferase 83A1 [Forsythia ovata]|uniref:Glycosyltransferase n=1 Tax=Forsythia ovata TaxID=205694 RepID=A0ABD1UUE8_9LAMI